MAIDPKTLLQQESALIQQGKVKQAVSNSQAYNSGKPVTVNKGVVTAVPKGTPGAIQTPSSQASSSVKYKTSAPLQSSPPPPGASPNLPVEFRLPTSPLQSTYDLQQQESATRQQGQNRMNEINNLDTQFQNIAPSDFDYIAFGQTYAGSDAEKRVAEKEQRYSDVVNRNFDQAEQDRIKAAEDAARAKSEAAVREAEAQKTQGMAKNIVAAGQRGGFLNTQYAGLAALLPTEGGTFVGAGGELERIQSAYDANIADAKSNMEANIAEARSAAEKAIVDGAFTDLEIADRAYERAKTSFDDIQELQRQKRQDLISFEKTRRELLQYQREDTAMTFEALIADGKTVDDVPDWYFKGLDAQLGYAEGTSRGLFKLTEDTKKDQDYATELEQTKQLTELLTSLPVGESVEIGGVSYTSLNQGTIETFSTDDGNGNMTIVSFNQDTGEYSQKTLYGVSQKNGWEFQQQNGVGVWVNPNTQEMRVAYDTNQFNDGQPTNTGVYGAFPEGSFGDECVIYCQTLTDFPGRMDVYNGQVEHSFRAKMSHTDPSITAENVTPGMIGVLNMGSYGHVVTVMGTSVVDGKIKVQVTESNLDGNGTVSYGEYDASQIKGYIPTQFKPEFDFGTGSVNQATALRNFSATPGEAPKVTKINGVDSVWDSALGKFVPATVANTENAVNPVIDAANTALNKIAEIRNSPGFNNAVGQSGLQRFSGVRPGQDTAFIGYVQELTSSAVLDQLIAAKAEGATFGALSEGELKLLKESASRIARWEKKDRNGNVVGYKVNQRDFLNALSDLERQYSDAIQKAGGSLGGVTSSTPQSTPNVPPPAGEIWVKDKNGNVGSIPEGEFDPSLYTRVGQQSSVRTGNFDLRV
jgi:hypothetical protein